MFLETSGTTLGTTLALARNHPRAITLPVGNLGTRFGEGKMPLETTRLDAPGIVVAMSVHMKSNRSPSAIVIVIGAVLVSQACGSSSDSPVDASTLRDAEPERGPDASGTPFACGDQTCAVGETFCEGFTPRVTSYYPADAGPVLYSYSCRPFPDSCPQHDCACLVQHQAGNIGCTCSTSDSGGVSAYCSPI